MFFSFCNYSGSTYFLTLFICHSPLKIRKTRSITVLKKFNVIMDIQHKRHSKLLWYIYIYIYIYIYYIYIYVILYYICYIILYILYYIDYIIYYIIYYIFYIIYCQCTWSSCYIKLRCAYRESFRISRPSFTTYYGVRYVLRTLMTFCRNLKA